MDESESLSHSKWECKSRFWLRNENVVLSAVRRSTTPRSSSSLVRRVDSGTAINRDMRLTKLETVEENTLN